MKKFAKLGSNNEVLKVNIVHDDVAPTEQAGIDFLKKLHNHSSWKQTFVKGSQRKNDANKGMTYDAAKDAFIHIQPYTSWILNEDTCLWEAPVAKPDDGKRYQWNEETVNWKEYTL